MISAPWPSESRRKKIEKPVLWIHIGFNKYPDPDPALYLNAIPGPDLGSQINADPDPGQTFYMKNIL